LVWRGSLIIITGLPGGLLGKAKKNGHYSGGMNPLPKGVRGAHTNWAREPFQFLKKRPVGIFSEESDGTP